MPLPLIGPVVVNGANTPAASGPPKHAIAIRLSEETIHAIKLAISNNPATTANSNTGGRGSLQVELSGSAPGLTIGGAFYPITLATERIHELYIRTRHHNPTKPIHHRPPFNYEAQVHAKATVARVLDDSMAGKVKDRYLQAEKDKQKRKPMLLPEAPKPSTTTPGATTVKKRKVPGNASTSLSRQAMTNGLAAKVQQPKSSNPSGSSTPNPPTPVPSKPSSSTSTPVPGPSSSSSSSSSSLQSRVVHSLALKPMTAKDLAALLNVDTNTELSDILRKVAEVPQADTRISNSHWSPGYSAGAKSPGIWKLRTESYEAVDPFGWSSYEPADRRRIAEDIRAAYKAVGFTPDTPEYKKLRREEKAWLAAQPSSKAGDDEGVANNRKPVLAPPAVRKKVKMKNLSDPASAGGSILSSKAFRGGQLDDSVSTKKTEKVPKPKTGLGTKKDRIRESDWIGDPASANPLIPAVPLKKKRPSPPPSVPLQPPPALAPPAQIHSRKLSHTPPPPANLPPSKGAHGLPPKPSPSPRPSVSSTTSKRKRDDPDDTMDEFGAFPPPSRLASGKSSQDEKPATKNALDPAAPPKKRKVLESKDPLTNGSASATERSGSTAVHRKMPSTSASASVPASTSTIGRTGTSVLNGKQKPKTNAPTPVPGSPPPIASGSHSRTASATKIRDRGSIDASASQPPPPATQKKSANAPPPALPPKARAEVRKQMAMYTDSEEEEEDESEAAPPPKVAASAKPRGRSPAENGVKGGRPSVTQVQKVKDRTTKERSRSPLPPSQPNAAPAKGQVASKPKVVKSHPSTAAPTPSPPSRNGLSSLPPRRPDGPLPTDLDELQKRWYEDYIVYTTLYSLVQLETQKLQKALKQVQLVGESDTMDVEVETVDVVALQELRDRYEDMHKEMMVMKQAMADAAASAESMSE